MSVSARPARACKFFFANACRAGSKSRIRRPEKALLAVRKLSVYPRTGLLKVVCDSGLGGANWGGFQERSVRYQIFSGTASSETCADTYINLVNRAM